MRDYGKIGPTFWTRGSGKRLRGDALGIALAQYLCTCPASNMIGLYHVSIPTIAHDMGFSVEEIRAALGRVALARFASFDEDNDLVFVRNGAAFQIGERLKPADKRVEGVARELRAYGDHPFVEAFLDLYAEAFCLDRARFGKGLPSPFDGAPEGASGRSEGGPACARDSAPALAPASDLSGVQGGGGEAPSSGDVAPAPPRTDLGGLEAETWAEGIGRATGKPCSPPGGGEVHAIRGVLAANTAGLDAGARAAWLRDAAHDYAKANAGQMLDGWKFATWIRSGRPTRAPTGKPRALQPVPATGRLWKPGKEQAS